MMHLDLQQHFKEGVFFQWYILVAENSTNISCSVRWYLFSSGRDMVLEFYCAEALAYYASSSFQFH